MEGALMAHQPAEGRLPSVAQGLGKKHRWCRHEETGVVKMGLCYLI